VAGPDGSGESPWPDTSLSPMADTPIPRLLSIAGSDSGGCAGIQADLKAFAACGVHGMTALTAITAQNTVGVTAVHQVPAAVIEAQVAAVAEDIGIDAIKIGMLGNAATIEAVARALRRLDGRAPVVLDPVMVSESGSVLLEPESRTALIEVLLPMVTVITPNLPEARSLLGHPELDAVELAQRIRELGPGVVVVTGGHRETPADVYCDGRQLVELYGERHPDGAAHGSGCTHSSVLAARLGWGDDPLSAATIARRAAGQAVADGLRQIGSGAGPVDILGIAAGPLTSRTGPLTEPAAGTRT
jgi:hydroxymethylpyrimidine/phosphomethylpyrimidine kinase